MRCYYVENILNNFSSDQLIILIIRNFLYFLFQKMGLLLLLKNKITIYENFNFWKTNYFTNVIL